MSLNALISMALPDGSLKNNVLCSPISPLNLTVGLMIKSISLSLIFNKKSSNSLNSQILNEDDLLIDIYSLNDQETDTVRLDASTIKQLFDALYHLYFCRK